MADGTDLETVSTLAGQCAFAQKSDNNHTSDVPDKMGDEEDDQDVESMMSAKNVATPGICNTL